MEKCEITGCNSAINGNFVGGVSSIDPLVMRDCEIHGNATGLNLAGPTLLYGCYIHDNTSNGYEQIGTGTATAPVQALYGCVVANNGGIGIACSEWGSNSFAALSLLNCVIYNNTSDGIKLTNQFPLILINNIVYGNGGYGLNLSGFTVGYAATSMAINIQRDNAFGSNTSGNRNANLRFPVGDVTLTGNPFNAPSSGDFSLNQTAGAGAACIGAGWQSSII